MVLKTSLLALIGVAMASIAHAGQAAPTETFDVHAQQSQIEAARILSELVRSGHVIQDPATGKLVRISSVVEILKDKKLIKNLDSARPDAMGNCGSTHGGGGTGGVDN